MLTENNQRILMVANNKDYITKISKRLDMSYCSVCQNINTLEELGLLGRKKEGRNQVILLTPKGKIVKDALTVITTELK